VQNLLHRSDALPVSQTLTLVNGLMEFNTDWHRRS